MPPDSNLFAALDDPIRRRILELLLGGSRPVSEIASHFPVSRPAISKHLRILREAGVVSEQRQGRRRLYRLDPEPIAGAIAWLQSLERIPVEEELPPPVEELEEPIPPRDDWRQW